MGPRSAVGRARQAHRVASPVAPGAQRPGRGGQGRGGQGHGGQSRGSQGSTGQGNRARRDETPASRRHGGGPPTSGLPGVSMPGGLHRGRLLLRCGPQGRRGARRRPRDADSARLPPHPALLAGARRRRAQATPRLADDARRCGRAGRARPARGRPAGRTRGRARARRRRRAHQPRALPGLQAPPRPRQQRRAACADGPTWHGASRVAPRARRDRQSSGPAR